MPKVSVIMPSLNVAKYYDACIQSVLNQTMQDIEILAVDAGSTDGTLEKIKDYVSKDKRVQLIKSSQKSYGHQMNLGIARATGKYIGIVETDDMIVPDMFEKLLYHMMDESIDFVKGAVDCFIEIRGGEIYSWRTQGVPSFFLPGTVVAPCDKPRLLIYDIYHWQGLYRADFIKDKKFNETLGAAFQDQGFLLQTLSTAKRAIYLDDVVYLYRQDNGGSSQRDHNSFGYILHEYQFNKRHIEKLNDKWKSIFYIRLIEQFAGRIDNMAMSGEYWDGCSDDISGIVDMLKKAREKGYLSDEMIPVWRRGEVDSLIDSPYGCFMAKSKKIRENRKIINNFYEHVSKADIVLAGAGTRGKIMQIWLKNKWSKEIKAFCDNGKELIGKKIYGAEIIATNIAVKKYHEASFIVTSRKYAEEIKHQLIGFGISEERIIVADFDLSVNVLL